MSIRTKDNGLVLARVKSFCFLSLSFFIFPACAAMADTIYLKNGRSIDGFVIKEEKDRVELDIGYGTVSFEPKEIDRVYKTTPGESNELRKKWEEEKTRSEEVRKEQEKEQERKPKETELAQSQGHIIVDALLNNKIHAQLILDTGASYVVLSENIFKNLGIDTAGETKTVKLEVADGRKVDAKFLVLKSVNVEGAQANDVEAAIMPNDTVDAGIKDGVLGMSFLKRFNFKVDQGKNKLILEKI